MAERNKLKVYLESSFVSYLTGRETDDAKIAADQAHTRRWMREQADLCELRISQFVVDESMKGPQADVARREAFMRGKKFAAADMKKVSRLAKQLLKDLLHSHAFQEHAGRPEEGGGARRTHQQARDRFGDGERLSAHGTGQGDGRGEKEHVFLDGHQLFHRQPEGQRRSREERDGVSVRSPQE